MQPPDGITDLGFVRCLEDDSHGPAAADVVKYFHQFAGSRRFPEIESRSHDRRPEHGQFEFECGFHGGGEPVRGLHDDVDDERTAAQPHLAALPVEIDDRLGDVCRRAGPHTGALVQDAIDGRLAQPGLPGDLTDRVGVGHARSLMDS